MSVKYINSKLSGAHLFYRGKSDGFIHRLNLPLMILMCDGDADDCGGVDDDNQIFVPNFFDQQKPRPSLTKATHKFTTCQAIALTHHRP